MKKRLFFIALAYTAGLVVLFFLQRGALARLLTLAPLSLLLLIAGQIAIQGGNSLFNCILYRSGGHTFGLPASLRLVVHSQLLDLTVPKGGLLFRLAYIQQTLGLSPVAHVALLALGAMVILITLASLGLASGWAVFGRGAFSPGQAFVIAALAGIALLAAWKPTLRFLSRRARWLEPLGSLATTPARQLLPLFVSCAVNQLAASLLLSYCFHLLGVSLTPPEAVLYASATSLVGVFGITPGGLGLQELALVAVSYDRVSAGDAALCALLSRAAGLLACVCLLPATAFLGRKGT